MISMRRSGELSNAKRHLTVLYPLHGVGRAVIEMMERCLQWSYAQTSCRTFGTWPTFFNILKSATAEFRDMPKPTVGDLFAFRFPLPCGCCLTCKPDNAGPGGCKGAARGRVDIAKSLLL